MAAILLQDGNDTMTFLLQVMACINKKVFLLVNLHIKCNRMAKPFLTNSSRLLGSVILWVRLFGMLPSLSTYNKFECSTSLYIKWK